MARTVAVVQARMGSSRLPGKVMLPIRGRTVLAHVLERCGAIPGVHRLCCAVPQSPDCDLLADEARRAGAEIFRGDEHDVLDRYYWAAAALAAEVVLRVTADCPLIDPELCAEVLAVRTRESADYACNNQPRTWPHGLDCEAFTFEWLTRAWREARQPAEREHVTPYIRTHPEARRCNVPAPRPGLERYRWTLDTPSDFEHLKWLFAGIPAGPSGWRWQETLRAADREGSGASEPAWSARPAAGGEGKA